MPKSSASDSSSSFGSSESCRDGAQAYWVCPLIEESEALQLQTAIETFETLKETFPQSSLIQIAARDTMVAEATQVASRPV